MDPVKNSELIKISNGLNAEFNKTALYSKQFLLRSTLKI